jgi:cell wall-associated NlpC family hydrolase
MDKNNDRKQFVDAALKYLGVKYVHQARSPYGMDCVGLIYRAATDVGIILPSYPQDYRGSEDQRIEEYLSSLMHPVSVGQIGDILAYRSDNGIVHHVGIQINDKLMVHSTDRVRKPGVGVIPLSWRSPDIIFDFDSFFERRSGCVFL